MKEQASVRLQLLGCGRAWPGVAGFLMMLVAAVALVSCLRAEEAPPPPANAEAGIPLGPAVELLLVHEFPPLRRANDLHVVNLLQEQVPDALLAAIVNLVGVFPPGSYLLPTRIQIHVGGSPADTGKSQQRTGGQPT